MKFSSARCSLRLATRRSRTSPECGRTVPKPAFWRNAATRYASLFAERLLGDATLTDDQRLDQAHLESFGRPPTPEEKTDARDFLAAYLAAQAAQARPEADRRLSAWQSYCQSLLCSNEFLYVD